MNDWRNMNHTYGAIDEGQGNNGKNEVESLIEREEHSYHIKTNWKGHAVILILSIGLVFLLIELSHNEGSYAKIYTGFGQKAKSVTIVGVAEAEQLEENAVTQALFQEFKETFGKKYKDLDEEMLRFETFKKNVAEAALKNGLLVQANGGRSESQSSATARYGVTKFSDWTAAEFAARNVLRPEPLFALVHGGEGADRHPDLLRARKHAGYVPMSPVADEIPCNTCTLFPELGAYTRATLPKSFDWRDFADGGVAGPVYDQGFCGSCWAFSAKQNLEGQWYLNRGVQKNLAAEELVACDDHVWGCDGGFATSAFESAVQWGGLVPTKLWPYTSGEDWEVPACNRTLVEGPQRLGRVAGWTLVKGDDHYVKLALVRLGPLSVALKANGMQFYTEGVDNGSLCTGFIDHAVLLVGWGEEDDGTKFWIVKNSWGEDWGEGGYYRVQIQDDDCKVAAQAATALWTTDGFPSPEPFPDHDLVDPPSPPGASSGKKEGGPPSSTSRRR